MGQASLFKVKNGISKQVGCRYHFRKCIFRKCIFLKFANFWRARSRLYQDEILQENMRSTAFFKLYKSCILLHRCKLKISAKNRSEKSAIFVKIQQHSCKLILQNLQFFAKCQKFQLDNLVDFEKCCKTRICLQRSVTTQPKTSENLAKICRR